MSREGSRSNLAGEAPDGGCVLCVAPLMGCEPALDSHRGQWLHCHVRPPVTALLKVSHIP